MKNKGFTLVEIIISLVLLAAIGLLIATNLNKSFDKFNEDEYDQIVSRINSAVDIYVDNNPNIKNELESTKAFVYVTIKELMDAGLLDKNILKNNRLIEEEINENHKVKVSLDANGLYLIEFKPEREDDYYLIAKNIIISDEKSFDCESYKNEDVSFVEPINGDLIESLNPDFEGHIKSINCDQLTKLSGIVPGTYEIEYKYTTPNSNVERIYKRTVIVYSELLEKTEVSLSVDSAIDSKGYFIYGERITYRLTITNNSLLKRTINVRDLLIREAIKKYDIIYPNNINQPNAYKFFSETGLTFDIDPESTREYSFDLIVTAQAGYELKYQTEYNINNKVTSQTPEQTKNVEKIIELSAISSHGANIILTLDVSTSMKNNSRLTNLETAANDFIDMQELESSEICIEPFSTYAPLENVLCSKNNNDLKAKVSDLKVIENTGYYNALITADNIFYPPTSNYNKKFSDSTNKNYIIFISDGHPNGPDYQGILAVLKNKGIIFYTISVDMDNDNLKQMASVVDGVTYYYESSSSNLKSVFANISRSINNTGNNPTQDGLLYISDIDPNEEIKFIVNETQIVEFDNAAAAAAKGYIVNQNQVNIKKFAKTDKILFVYSVLKK